ncbi:MAG: hypothetical protein AAF587_05615 [Bacteroidota bacterium]
MPFPDGFFTAVGEAFLLMLIAAILGFIIAWLLFRNRYQALLGQHDELTGKYSNLQNKYDALLLQHDELKPKYQELQTAHEKQGRQLKECGQSRTELDMELTQIRPFKDKFEMLQVDHNAKIKAHDELLSQHKSLSVKAGGLETALKEERESNLGLTSQLAVLKSNQAKAEAEAIESRAIDLSGATTEEAKPKAKAKKKETQEEALERIKQKASGINFDRIGIANISDKDDLKRVKGIGPFIEKKLNALGIYTFRQIANFTAEDEDIVNDAIEFFPGRIRRDSWSSQSESFADEKDKQKEENSK